MDELKWELLVEVYGRMEAEVIESYLKANGIDVELFQEAVGHNVFPTTLDAFRKVQLFVPKEMSETAHRLMEEYEKPVEQAEEETDEEHSDSGHE